MDADGGRRKQLTSSMGQNMNPHVSPDGRYIVFTSNRDGRRNVWRMDITGNNPKRLSDGIADALPAVSIDSKWVFTVHWLMGSQLFGRCRLMVEHLFS